MGFNITRLGGLAVSDWIFASAVLVLAFQLLTDHRRGIAPIDMRRSPPLVLFGSILLLTASTLSSLFSLNPSGSMAAVTRLGWLTLIWFWLLRSVSPDDARFARLINGFKIAIVVSAIAGIASHTGVIELGQLSAGTSDNRQAAWFEHPNSLAGFLAIGLPFFALDVPRSGQHPYGRSIFFRLPSCGLLLVAIGATGSMTAVIAYVVGFVVIGALVYLIPARIHRPHDPVRRMVAILLVGSASVVFLSTGNTATERFSRWQQGDASVSGSVSSRGDHADSVLDNFQSLLVVGTGFGDAADTTVAGGSFNVHNMYLRVLQEGGLPALLGLLLILFAAVDQCWKLLAHTRRTIRFPLVLAILSAISINLTRSFFQPTLTQRFFWFPIACAGVLWVICRHELRASPSPSDATAAANITRSG